MSKAGRRKIASHAGCHRRKWVAVLVSAWSTSAHTVITAWATVHWHRRVPVCIAGSTRTATSTCGANAGVTHRVHWVQRSAVVVAAGATVLAVGLLALHFKGSKLGVALAVVDLSATAHWWRAVSSGKLIRKHTLLAKVFIVIRAAHVCVFGDTLFASLSAYKGTAHSAGHDTGCNNEDCSRKHDPTTPLDVGHEQENVHQEGQQSYQQGRDGENKESQEEARRMSRRMEMRSNSQRKADQYE